MQTLKYKKGYKYQTVSDHASGLSHQDVVGRRYRDGTVDAIQDGVPRAQHPR